MGTYKKMQTLWAALFALGLGGELAAQNCPSWAAYPGGEAAAQEKYVLYSDRFKAKNYAEAFPHWEQLFAHVKQLPKAPTKLFRDGIAMYQAFMDTEKDAAKKADMVKKMAALYEEMFKCNAENATDRAYQGYYMWMYGADAAENYKIEEKAVELGKKESSYLVLRPMSILAVKLYKSGSDAGKFTKDYMRALYTQLKEIADAGIAANKNNTGASYQTEWQVVEAEFAKIADDIFDCAYFENKYQPVFKADPNNQEQNIKLLRELKGKCGEEGALYKEIWAVYEPWAKAKAEKEFMDNFDKLTEYEKGSYHENKGDKDKAYDHYEKALENPNDPKSFPADATNDMKAKTAMRVAYYYESKGSFSTARNFCRKASTFLPNWGEPHLVVGRMYASSGKTCDPSGKGVGFDAQVVVWPAIDEWSKAKSDPTTADEAAKYINKYRQYMPTKADVFKRNLKVGDSYSVGCWIGVSSTIRTAD